MKKPRPPSPPFPSATAADMFDAMHPRRERAHCMRGGAEAGLRARVPRDVARLEAAAAHLELLVGREHVLDALRLLAQLAHGANALANGRSHLRKGGKVCEGSRGPEEGVCEGRL
jgi:hypothetical protein